MNDDLKENKIYCCKCEKEIKARLTTGKEIYPHRKDLAKIPFWTCDVCNNYVGTHHKTKNKFKPLGVIPSYEIIQIRKSIHSILDPLWKSGKINRNTLYDLISKKLGKRYHTAEIRTIKDANLISKILQEIKKEIFNEV